MAFNNNKIYCNKPRKESGDFAFCIYEDFVAEYRWNKDYPFYDYPDEYDGAAIMKLSCSQHMWDRDGMGPLSDYQQKKITESWVKFFQEKKNLPMKEVQVCTRMSQAVFDALCNHSAIESLKIKWFAGKNVDKIESLTNLKKLFIEAAPSLESIAPIAELSNLEVLILGDTRKITDYSALGKLKKVKVLGICSYQTRNTIIHMEDDSFMADMTSLEYIDMYDVRIENRVYLTPENVKDKEFALFHL